MWLVVRLFFSVRRRGREVCERIFQRFVHRTPHRPKPISIRPIVLPLRARLFNRFNSVSVYSKYARCCVAQIHKCRLSVSFGESDQFIPKTRRWSHHIHQQGTILRHHIRIRARSRSSNKKSNSKGKRLCHRHYFFTILKVESFEHNLALAFVHFPCAAVLRALFICIKMANVHQIRLHDITCGKHPVRNK